MTLLVVALTWSLRLRTSPATEQGFVNPNTLEIGDGSSANCCSERRIFYFLAAQGFSRRRVFVAKVLWWVAKDMDVYGSVNLSLIFWERMLFQLYDFRKARPTNSKPAA
jgi:hypothetical protein